MRTRKLDAGGAVALPALYDEALFYSLDALAEVVQNKITRPELVNDGDIGQ